MTDQGNRAGTDVVIVGSGFTGALTAGRFAEAGYSVTVIERGEWPDYSSSRAEQPDFEAGSGNNWVVNPNRRNSRADQPIDDADSDIAAIMLNAVGGSSVAYGGQWHRSMPSDFCTRSLEGVGDDWPLSYEDLIP
ncbi:FAD-dependent oxidoreductase [Streptomyces sp. BH106]|uniref:FAD-dependent oxidoreductase n=1 Tax=Streptomyces sp. BH106 TaxID=3410409 RepID=UPI003CE804A6